MIDADVQREIVAILEAGLAGAGIAADVLKAYNPTTQGPPLKPTVLYTKIAGPRYGFQGAKYDEHTAPGPYILTESWFVRDNYQINALITQDPTVSTSLSAYDVVSLCAAVLQSQSAGVTFKAAGIGRERITGIRTPSFKDESGRFITNPSFDFVLSYRNSLAPVSVPEAGVEGVVINVGG